MTRKMNPLLSLTLSFLLFLGGCGASYTGGQTSAVLPPSPTPTPTPAPVRTMAEAAPSKDETVYVNANALGKPERIEVDAVLSGHAQGNIPDVSILKDIRNTEGDETFTAEGTSLLWENKGADIHYKGTADADANLPVTETVTYYLDGREITPEDLAGQSGRVKIRFDFENHTAEKVDLDRKTIRSKENENLFNFDWDESEKSEDKADDPDEKAGQKAKDEVDETDKKAGQKTEDKEKAAEISEPVTYESVPIPFTVITMAVLPQEGFSNITVKNGRLLTMDDSNIAVGVCLPGLQDFLTAGRADLTEDLDLPDYVEIEADVTDFKLSFTASIVSAGLLQEADLSSLDDLAKLRGDMLSLTEASQDITSALQEMENGTSEFSDGISAYVDGVSKLSDGLGELSSGAKTLKNSSSALTEGASALSQGLLQLKSSLPAFPDLPAIDESGIEAASQALLKDLTALSGNLTALTETEGAISDLLAALAAAAGKTDEAAQALTLYEENRNALLAALSGTSDALNTASAALQGAAEGAGDAAQTAAAAQIMTAAAEALEETDLSDEEKAALVQTIADKADISEAVSKAVAASQAGLAETLSALNTALTKAQSSLDLSDTGTDVQTLSDLSDKLRDLAGTLDQESLGRIQADLKSLKKAIEGSGIPQLMSSIEKDVDKSGKKIKDASSLTASLKELQKTYKALQDGIASLASGSAQLSSGISQYTAGVSQLADGISAVKSGGSELSSHGDELKDGTAELTEAISKFRRGFEDFSKDGVRDLTDFVNEDLSDLADRIKAIKESDGRYETWSGLAEGTKGSVRFILETAEIKSE